MMIVIHPRNKISVFMSRFSALARLRTFATFMRMTGTLRMLVASLSGSGTSSSVRLPSGIKIMNLPETKNFWQLNSTGSDSPGNTDVFVTSGQVPAFLKRYLIGVNRSGSEVESMTRLESMLKSFHILVLFEIEVKDSLKSRNAILNSGPSSLKKTQLHPSKRGGTMSSVSFP